MMRVRRIGLSVRRLGGWKHVVARQLHVLVQRRHRHLASATAGHCGCLIAGREKHLILKRGQSRFRKRFKLMIFRYSHFIKVHTWLPNWSSWPPPPAADCWAAAAPPWAWNICAASASISAPWSIIRRRLSSTVFIMCVNLLLRIEIRLPI